MQRASHSLHLFQSLDMNHFFNVVGVILSGFSSHTRDQARSRSFEDFLSLPMVHVPSIGQTTADYYTLVFRSLKAAGLPIPANDLWIAASAMENGALLVTRDAHFRAIQNLRCWFPLR